jgi:16S rRNA (guanine527-N7)-methyltransferase
MELIHKYFPESTEKQVQQYQKLLDIIPVLNKQVNVISRKDIDYLEEKHLLHSLSLAKIFSYSNVKRILDAGTGGGFPGIPLAIFFPEIQFILVDSIGKKIRLVDEACKFLGVSNVKAIHERVEKISLPVQLVVTRAVAPLEKLDIWTRALIEVKESAEPNGLLALKGGDLEKELSSYRNRVEIYPISHLFEEEFFLTKKIVYLKK